VEELERSSEPAAELALAVFAKRVAAAVAAMTTSLGGLDALVFTGGVGEGSAPVRADVCRRLTHLGVRLDEEADEGEAPVRVEVVPAREDVIAAREARSATAASATS
jgi:acetate kinase